MNIYNRFKNLINRVDGTAIKQVKPEGFKYHLEYMEIPANMEEMILSMIGEKLNPVEVYLSVWNAYRCVNLIAENMSTLPIKLNDKSENEITEDGALNILTWKANDMYTGQLFIQSAQSFIELYGNAYLWLTVGVPSLPKEMWSLQPSKVRVVPYSNKDGVKQYVYTKGMGPQNIDPKVMMHIRLFNPASDYVGASKTDVGSTIISSQQKSEEWNKNLLSNSAKPTMLLFPKDKLTPDQREQLKKEFREKHQGGSNAGNILILPSNMANAVKGEFSPVEADWDNLQKTSLRKVCNLYGVPSELLGDSESNTFSNRKEARASFYTETVIPRGEYFLSWCNHFFYPERDKHLFIDKKNIEALQAVWLDKVNALNLSDWMAPNEKRIEMGMEKSKEKAMDKIWIGVNKVPIDEAGPDTGDGL